MVQSLYYFFLVNNPLMLRYIFPRSLPSYKLEGFISCLIKLDIFGRVFAFSTKADNLCDTSITFPASLILGKQESPLTLILSCLSKHLLQFTSLSSNT